MDQSICLRSDLTKSFNINPVMFFLSPLNRKIAFYLQITDNDTLHDIHILFFDLLLALYYSINIL